MQCFENFGGANAPPWLCACCQSNSRWAKCLSDKEDFLRF